MLFSCWIFTCACEHCFTCFIPFNIHGSGLRWPALPVSISPAPEDGKPDAFFPPSLAARELFWPRRHRKICPGEPWKTFPPSWREMGSLGDFLSLIPPPARIAPSLKLELQNVRNDASGTTVAVSSGVGKSRRAPGVYSHTTGKAANLDWSWKLSRVGPD